MLAESPQSGPWVPPPGLGTVLADSPQSGYWLPPPSLAGSRGALVEGLSLVNYSMI